jgi:hypothetical protein
MSFKAMTTSERIIEVLVASLPEEASERDRYLYREALHGLVRLAQVEQIVSLEQDFQTAYYAASPHYRRSA